MPFPRLVAVAAGAVWQQAVGLAGRAVADGRAASIRPVRVTGDHKLTGLAIARHLGIAREGERAVDGLEPERMGESKPRDELSGIAVFARARLSCVMHPLRYAHSVFGVIAAVRSRDVTNVSMADRVLARRNHGGGRDGPAVAGTEPCRDHRQQLIETAVMFLKS